MLALMRRAATWRPIFHEHSCQFCCGGSPHVVTEQESHGLVQSTSQAKSSNFAKKLGLRLKQTHDKLLSDLKQGREFKEIWSEHRTNISDLSEYAATMNSMAQHWEAMNARMNGRNAWIEAEVRHYYNERSNLAALQEEMRRARVDLALLTPLQQDFLLRLQPALNAYWKQQMQKDLRDLRAGSENPKKRDGASDDGQSARGSAKELDNGLPGDSCSLRQALVYSDCSCDTGQLRATNRVRVLDVGSCYNPLGRYPHLLVTPIDLMPATQDVYKCDFLDVKVVEASEGCDLPAVELQDAGAVRQIERLPRNYYDVIVFSLVLDYIPCPEARLRCCSKAHQLLTPGGLLLMIAPVASGALSEWLFKWIQLHLARLGFHRLKKRKNGKYWAFTFRKGFFPLLWSENETKRIKNELLSMQNYLKGIEYRAEYDKVDLDKGLYFIRDLKVNQRVASQFHQKRSTE